MTLRLLASRRWRRTRRAGQKTRRSLKTQRLTAQTQAENRKELVSRCECSPILSRMTDEYALKDIRARVRVWVWALDSRFLTLDSWFSILESIFLRHRQINDQLTELKLMCYWFSVGFCCGSVIADPVGFFEGPANGNLFNLLGQPVPICDCAVFCAAYVVQGEVVCFGPTAGKHSKNNLKGKNSVHPKVMENNPRGSYGNLFTLPMAGSINNALKFK